jgi:hypothetical protein
MHFLFQAASLVVRQCPLCTLHWHAHCCDGLRVDDDVRAGSLRKYIMKGLTVQSLLGDLSTQGFCALCTALVSN